MPGRGRFAIKYSCVSDSNRIDGAASMFRCVTAVRRIPRFSRCCSPIAPAEKIPQDRRSTFLAVVRVLLPGCVAFDMMQARSNGYGTIEMGMGAYSGHVGTVFRRDVDRHSVRMSIGA
jgi:hypothetical protein